MKYEMGFRQLKINAVLYGNKQNNKQNNCVRVLLLLHSLLCWPKQWLGWQSADLCLTIGR